MSIWILKPQVKDNVEEIQRWEKNSRTLIRKEIFSTVTMFCQNDTRPDIDLVNPDGIEVIQGSKYAWSMSYLESKPNGPWVTWVYPDDMTDEEKSSIEKLTDVGLYSELETLGWGHAGIEYWIRGPLSLTEQTETP